MKKLKVWEPSDAEELTPAVIHQIVCDIEDGNPDPEQAKRLLHHYVECTRRHRPPSEPLVRHLTNAFANFLVDPEDGNLERLLGLRSPANRPTENTRRDQQMAWEVLTRVLRGETVTRATAMLATKQLGPREFEKAWVKHKTLALTMEKITRIQNSIDGKSHWSASEDRQLAKYFRPKKITP